MAAKARATVRSTYVSRSLRTGREDRKLLSSRSLSNHILFGSFSTPAPSFQHVPDRESRDWHQRRCRFSHQRAYASQISRFFEAFGQPRPAVRRDLIDFARRIHAYTLRNLVACSPSRRQRSSSRSTTRVYEGLAIQTLSSAWPSSLGVLRSYSQACGSSRAGIHSVLPVGILSSISSTLSWVKSFRPQSHFLVSVVGVEAFPFRAM